MAKRGKKEKRMRVIVEDDDKAKCESMLVVKLLCPQPLVLITKHESVQLLTDTLHTCTKMNTLLKRLLMLVFRTPV